MASYRKRAGSWRVEVYRNGKRQSATFPTKAECAAWALRVEAELEGATLPSKTLAEALERYAAEVAPTHRGARWEQVRCRQILRDWPAVRLPVSKLTNDDFARWRDDRLRVVAPGSVAREMTLMRAVLEAARRDWGWIRENPIKGVRWPTQPPARRRRISEAEVDAMLAGLGYRRGLRPLTMSHRVAIAFLLCLETAMRSGEVCGLRWADVRPVSVVLPRTKNGDVREVPLSRAARALIELLPVGAPGDRVLGVADGSRDTLWRRARAAAVAEHPELRDLADLHFHDARAEAIWRLSKKLDVLDLARVIGHRDPRSLMLYYNATAEELAEKLG